MSEPIVISGISGKCSNSNNLQEMRDHLYNKEDMITENPRFDPSLDVPGRCGIIPDISKFDHAFFDMPQHHIERMTAGYRVLLEVVCESLFDAGLNLNDMENTNTGIYTCNSYSPIPSDGMLITGYRSFYGPGIAHFLKLSGQNYSSDAACSSSLFALERAVYDLQSGKVDYALVCGENLILSEKYTAQFQQLGLLSKDGKCKTFDAAANGYVRADGVFCVILQKASAAKRQYAELVDCLVNCDGFKKLGITFPSTSMQQKLLRDFYEGREEVTRKIGFIEAHGTGTIAGDPVEMKTIEDTFCEGRDGPVLVGSAKSNMGHSEAVSGLAALSKVCFIMNSGLIPPNIHYNNPNPNIEVLKTDKIKILTEVTPMPEDKPYVAISNYGFGGANGHVLLKKPSIAKHVQHIASPMLLCISGRTYAAIESIISDIRSRPFNADYYALINSAFNSNIQRHPYKCYAIAIKTGLTTVDTSYGENLPTELNCFFQTYGNVKTLSEISHFDCFQEHLTEVYNILSRHNIHRNVLDNEKLIQVEKILLNTIVQTGIVKILNLLGIKIANYCGSGIGELVAAYADSVISLEQVILIAHELSNILGSSENISQDLIRDKLTAICKTLQRPIKWLVSEEINGNIAEYLAKTILQLHSPKTDKSKNWLIIGGNAPHDKHVVSLCDTNDFLQSIGKLYQLGSSVDLNKLYKVQWPVPVDTPMISHLIKWKHGNKSWAWLRGVVEEPDTIKSHISINENTWHNIDGYSIDGRIIFPAAGYLYLAWRAFSRNSKDPVVFENVKFQPICKVPETEDLELTLQICKKTGKFEVSKDVYPIVTGTILFEPQFDEEWLELPETQETTGSMSLLDIYKELRVRGYYYGGNFRGIQDVDVDVTQGHIKWYDWVSYFDSMMQMQILKEDTRNLLLPTKIDKILLHPRKHLNIVIQSEIRNEPECLVPTYYYKDLNVVRSGFIEIRGLVTTPVAKRKDPPPVVESYKFVPYETSLDIRTATRVITQVALENLYVKKVNLLEVLPGNEETERLSPLIEDAIGGQPLITAEVLTINDDNLMRCNERNIYAAIGHNLSTNEGLLKILTSTLRTGGFLISRETNATFTNINNLSVLCKYDTGKETLILMRVNTELPALTSINITADNFEWLKLIQDARGNKENVLLYSLNEPVNGIMGLTNCLIKEGGAGRSMNVVVLDTSAPAFDINNNFYLNQLNKQLSINVYENGKWGMYRHLQMEPTKDVETNHTFAKYYLRGDLSTLSWAQGKYAIHEDKNIQADESLINVYATTVNIRDVRVACGKIPEESVTTDRKLYDELLGIEFAGKNNKGERVMGMTHHGGMTNLLKVKNNFCWNIPNEWSMTEAATVPLVYATTLYGLLMRANLQEGETILIHTATGGIGLAALNIVQHFKCKVFVTVGTNEKIDYILSNYPFIQPNHIGNSRNASFYEMIQKETNGKGVDLILNCVAYEKFEATLKCLKYEGRLIEIALFDSLVDNYMNTELAAKSAEYHGISMYNMLSESHHLLKQVHELISNGIRDGYVKPLPVKTFTRDEIQDAFNHIINEHHIGKTVITIHQEKANNNIAKEITPLKAKPQLYCKPNGCYIIVGGLGGYGLELADLLILRGAKNVILVSRSGVTNGYQQLRIKLWKSYNCNIEIFRGDVTTFAGCKALLDAAEKLGEVSGIFNLATVLSDSMIENQCIPSYERVYNSKAKITVLLDQLTRERFPKLDHFVVFSSITSGRGNVGQTNYGFANSVNEKICEKRRADGFSGKAIQWGGILDVGLVANMREKNVNVVIAGTMHQRIANCLYLLDDFLTNDDVTLSSIVLADKEKDENEDDNIINVVKKLLLIKNIKAVSMHTTFPELGMDSMMVVAIKQTLERDFDVFLTLQELRSMTFAKLSEITA